MHASGPCLEHLLASNMLQDPRCSACAYKVGGDGIVAAEKLRRLNDKWGQPMPLTLFQLV